MKHPQDIHYLAKYLALEEFRKVYLRTKWKRGMEREQLAEDIEELYEGQYLDQLEEEANDLKEMSWKESGGRSRWLN